jgi:hypothetical protein
MQNDDCEIGVKYDEVRPPKDQKVFSMPCWGEGNQSLCPKYSGYTLEELAAQAEQRRRSAENMIVARSAIVIAANEAGFVKSDGGDRGNRGNSVRGTIDCPVCKAAQALHFSRSSYNGHIHAKCKTPECVAWME